MTKKKNHHTHTETHKHEKRKLKNYFLIYVKELQKDYIVTKKKTKKNGNMSLSGRGMDS